MSSKLPVFETPFETYRAIKKIGEGGSGRVYEVLDSSDGNFAVKILSAERITTDKIKRFKNELNFCQKNTHENIVSVIDAGASFESKVKCPFYVMPYYASTLKTVLPNLVPNTVLPMFSKILDGVEAAHLLGVWHRDIKPENILFDDNSLVVADFGIAHFAVEELLTAVETKAANRLANFLYAAPEQKVKGGRVDHRADIYALGLVLNEMFTGEVAQGSGIKAIASVSASHSYLDDIVADMIQQNPANRPQSIQSIKNALIARKNEFIALQKLAESKRQVVKSSNPAEFNAIEITSLDYDGGQLILTLSDAPTQHWVDEFASVRGVRNAIMGYEPERFRFNGASILIPGVRNDQRLIQQLVDHTKQYVSTGNSGYISYLSKKAEQEEQNRREQLRKRIETDDQKVKALDTLSKIKL